LSWDAGTHWRLSLSGNPCELRSTWRLYQLEFPEVNSCEKKIEQSPASSRVVHRSRHYILPATMQARFDTKFDEFDDDANGVTAADWLAYFDNHAYDVDGDWYYARLMKGAHELLGDTTALAATTFGLAEGGRSHSSPVSDRREPKADPREESRCAGTGGQGDIGGQGPVFHGCRQTQEGRHGRSPRRSRRTPFLCTADVHTSLPTRARFCKIFVGCPCHVKAS
jgi:hypothetical protein